MSGALPASAAVGIVGAGTMGRGIAQVAAAAGHPVLLFDAREGAAAEARGQIESGLRRQVERGKLAADQANRIVERVRPAAALAELGVAALVIEAIAEDLAAKRELFAALEPIVRDEAILASNTSGLSISAIGSGLARPGRCVGMHFFNPAFAMRLVEVVTGLDTEDRVAACVSATAERWGKVVVRVKSSPGFIVNRVARPFYGEALRLLEEGAADAATLDAILVEAGGFRMGPFALMDLIGHDVNAAVTRGMFDAFGCDPRYRPSLYQQELVAAGRLGRKTGRGVYDYRQPRAEASSGDGAERRGDAALTLDGRAHDLDGAALVRTDGRPAVERALAERRPVILYDLAGDPARARRVAVATSPDVSEEALSRLEGTLDAAGIAMSRVADRPGLVVMRTMAMLANEGFEAALNGVASESDIDLAMEIGVNYPRGPIGWARALGLRAVLDVLTGIQAATGDPRYRVSLGLRLAAGAEALATATEKRQAQ